MEAHGLATSGTVHRASWATPARHFLEMVVAMWVGMAVGGLVFAPILAAMLVVIVVRREEYPQDHRRHARSRHVATPSG